MTIEIGRLDALGLAIEGTAGTPEAAPAVYLPFTDLSLNPKVESIAIKHAVTSRYAEVNSVPGKKWAEGDVGINLDMVNAGYLLKLAFGNEIYTAGTPSVHDFYVTTSGNTPKTATLWRARGDNDVDVIAYAAVDELTLSVEDGLASLKASFIGKFPTTAAGASLTPVTTSGTVMSFANYTVKLGATLAAAASATAIEPRKFSLKIKNGVESIFRAGSTDLDAVKTKGFSVEGDYELFFESVTERDYYRNLNKRAMIITFTGNANESLVIKIARVRTDSWKVDSNLDDFSSEGTAFVAELDTAQVPNVIGAVLNNSKAALY